MMNGAIVSRVERIASPINCAPLSRAALHSRAVSDSWQNTAARTVNHLEDERRCDARVTRFTSAESRSITIVTTVTRL